MFCKECGKQIDDNSKFCMFCGASFNEADISDNVITNLVDEPAEDPIVTVAETVSTATPTNIPPVDYSNANSQNATSNNVTKVKGRGKAITSLVLGIITIVWACIALSSYEEGLSQLYSIADSIAGAIGYCIGLNIVSLPAGIVGLCLGLSSKNKGGIRTAGIILNSIGLFLVSLTAIFVLSEF